jgi:hypothetical protein
LLFKLLQLFSEGLHRSLIADLQDGNTSGSSSSSNSSSRSTFSLLTTTDRIRQLQANWLYNTQ